jgi:hypothetical protein
VTHRWLDLFNQSPPTVNVVSLFRQVRVQDVPLGWRIPRLRFGIVIVPGTVTEFASEPEMPRIDIQDFGGTVRQICSAII